MLSIVHCENIPSGQTINKVLFEYQDVSLKEIQYKREAMRKKRPEAWAKKT